MLGRLITSYAEWVIRRPRRVILLVGVLTLLLAGAVARLRIEVDPDRQLPQEHPYIQTLNEVYRLFGDKNLVVVGLFPRDGDVFTPRFLAKISEVTDRLAAVPGANAALVQSLASARVIRGSPEGVDVERVIALPPSDAAGAAEVRGRAFSNGMVVGTLVAADGTAAAIQASFELTPATPGYRHLHAAVLDAVRQTDDGTFEYRLAGPVVFMSELSRYAGRVMLYFPLALIVIGAVHYHAFRTLQAIFLPLLTAMLAVVWALGLMGLLGIPLDPINTTTPILILAVAAGHAVQVLKRFYEEYDRVSDVEQATILSLIHVAPVMLAAGAVAGLSFCSLVTFDTETIRTFGLLTGFGIASTLAIELTIIPAVRVLLPTPRREELRREAAAHPWLDAFLEVAGRSALSRPRHVLAIGVMVLGVAVAGALQLDVQMSLKRQFGENESVRRDDGVLNERFAGTNTLVMLVDGGREGTLEEPAVLAAMDTLQRRLEREPGVGKATSFVDVVATMHAALNADRPDVGRLPTTRPLVAQYLFLHSLSGGGNDLDVLIDSSHRFAKIRVLVREDDTTYGKRLIALARDEVGRSFPPGYAVRFTGSLASTTAGLESMVDGKIRNIGQVIGISFVISALLLGSLTGALFVVVPLVLAVVVNFGVMAALGVSLDTVTAAMSAMAVGIGADYAMYLLFRVREELRSGDEFEACLARALKTSGKAILFVSTAIAAGYSTLMISGFRTHVALGGLVALAMVVSSLGALLLLPALMGWLRPRFLFRRRAGVQPVSRRAAA